MVNFCIQVRENIRCGSKKECFVQYEEKVIAISFKDFFLFFRNRRAEIDLENLNVLQLEYFLENGCIVLWILFKHIYSTGNIFKFWKLKISEFLVGITNRNKLFRWKVLFHISKVINLTRILAFVLKRRLYGKLLVQNILKRFSYLFLNLGIWRNWEIMNLTLYSNF